MSAQEIIAELPNLTVEERQAVKEKLEALQATLLLPKTSLGRVLLKYAGIADDLPDDMSVNHDHYLYGTSKRE